MGLKRQAGEKAVLGTQCMCRSGQVTAAAAVGILEGSVGARGMGCVQRFRCAVVARNKAGSCLPLPVPQTKIPKQRRATSFRFLPQKVFKETTHCELCSSVTVFRWLRRLWHLTHRLALLWQGLGTEGQQGLWFLLFSFAFSFFYFLFFKESKEVG